MSDIGKDMPNLLKIGKDAYIVVPSPQEDTNILGVSSLAASSKVVEKTGISAPSPRLAVPEFGIDQDGRVAINLDAFKYSVEHRYHKIIMSLLDKWLESIEVDEKRLREQLLSQAYLNWLDDMHIDFFESEDLSRTFAAEFKRYMLDTSLYSHWLDTLPADQKISELSKGKRYQIMAGLENAVSEYRDALQTNGPSPLAPFVIASLAIGFTYLGDYVRGDGDGLNPIASALAKMGKPLSEFPALGFLGSLLANGVVYQTSCQLAMRAGKVQENEVNLHFAREYGLNLVRLLNTYDFTLFLNAACYKKDPDDEELQELVSSVKFILLMTALGIIYKCETGKITDMEIAAILKGEIPVSSDPMQQRLKGEILARFREMGKLQQPILNAVLEYLNNNPDFKELFDVYRVFERIRKTDELNEHLHFEKGV